MRYAPDHGEVPEDRGGDVEDMGSEDVRGKKVEDAGDDMKSIEPVIAPAMTFM